MTLPTPGPEKNLFARVTIYYPYVGQYRQPLIFLLLIKYEFFPGNIVTCFCLIPSPIDISSKLLHQYKIVQKKKNTENYNILISSLRQTDKFIRTGVMLSQKFWQWGDDINSNDGITRFDGIFYLWLVGVGGWGGGNAGEPMPGVTQPGPTHQQGGAAGTWSSQPRDRPGKD
jgi:hypothetical protein